MRFQVTPVRVVLFAVLCSVNPFLYFTTQPMQAQLWLPQIPAENALHQYTGGFLGGGVSAADFDKDGWDDVLYCQRGTSPLLLRSNAGVLESIQVPFTSAGEIKQMSWVDIDNDGDRDLSVTGLDMPIRIFLNDSNVTFTSLPSTSGIALSSQISFGHSWADYDRDGDLDLFVCNYDAVFMGYFNSDNLLYRNEGDGTFSDVSLAAGFFPMENYSFMAIWMDYNRDLFPDLLVINDRLDVPNYFYHNNGDGTFTEVGNSANLDDYIFGMTATADDFDNDGDLDIYITNGTVGNLHKVNNGDGTFTDASEQLGTVLNRFCWGAQFIDADRDGWQDLHVCTTPHQSLLGQNYYYQNNGQVFLLANDSAGISADTGWSRSSAVGDINKDGLADIAISKSFPSVSSFWYAEPNANHWLKITLEGVQSNRDGVSSWIDCYSDSLVQSRYTYCGEGYLGQNSFSEFFGIGQTSLVDSILVHWPSGVVDRWTNVPVNQQLYLVEGSSRNVTIAAGNGNVLCVGDSLSFSVAEWSQIYWNTGETLPSIEIAEAGPLVATGMDVWGNVFQSDTTWVASSTLPMVTSVVENVSCYGLSDGSVSLSSASTGVQFELNGMSSTTGFFTNLSSGAYLVDLSDAFGCSTVVDFEVVQPDSFEVQAYPQQVTCFEGSDGSVEFAFDGGTPNYFILGDSTETTQLGAGYYLYVASDSNGCLALVTVSIEEPTPVSVEVESTPLTNGQSMGGIVCVATGGVPPYLFSLDSVFTASNSWQGLEAGVYGVTVIDSVGCSVQQSIEVSVVNALESIEKNDVHVYPNPCAREENLTVESFSVVDECRVYDSLGNKVSHTYPMTKRFQIVASALSPACYTIVLRSSTLKMVLQLVIIE